MLCNAEFKGPLHTSRNKCLEIQNLLFAVLNLSDLNTLRNIVISIKYPLCVSLVPDVLLVRDLYHFDTKVSTLPKSMFFNVPPIY